MKKTGRIALAVSLALALLLLPALSSCGRNSHGGSGNRPAATATPIRATPEPLETPSFTPSRVELPESYGFYELATAGLKNRVKKNLAALREDVFIKDGSCCGFLGNISFEYVTGDARHVPVTVSGVTYAPLEGLAKAFGADCEIKEGVIVLTYREASAEVSTDDDKVVIGGSGMPFRRPERIGGVWYASVENVALLFDYNTEETEGVTQMTAKERSEKASLEDAKALFNKYDREIYTDIEVECDTTGSGLYEPVEPSERLVGIAYTTWFRTDSKWGEGHTWDIPWLGGYSSLDRNVIRQHGIWLRDAGVDFVFVDWSNDVNYDPETMRTKRPDFRTIEDATEVLFDVWADIPGAPKICIFTGPGHVQGRNGDDPIGNGRMDAKTQQIYDTFIANERYRNMYFEFEGKPLLICYAATPAFFQDNISPYDDDRFTVRWITGYVGQQSNLYDSATLVSKMFWSWEERGAQTFTVLNNRPECMTVNAAYRSQGSTPGTEGYIAPGLRDNGNTFRKAWARARLIGPKIALVVSFNEWSLGEQVSLENAKDIEPSKTTGSFYLDLMREEIRKFKGLK
ncbi:MAG: hypothetical protein K6B54_05870 [Clostridia bacterium]|nr:hypothetical protein [Clostridia bacterium]